MRIVGLLGTTLILMAPALEVALNAQPLSGLARMKGAITAIDIVKKQIVVNGATTVQITPNTAIMVKGWKIGFETLSLGVTVVISGRMNGDALVAHEISIKYIRK